MTNTQEDTCKYLLCLDFCVVGSKYCFVHTTCRWEKPPERKCPILSCMITIAITNYPFCAKHNELLNSFYKNPDGDYITRKNLITSFFRVLKMLHIVNGVFRNNELSYTQMHSTTA